MVRRWVREYILKFEIGEGINEVFELIQKEGVEADVFFLRELVRAYSTEERGAYIPDSITVMETFFVG